MATKKETKGGALTTALAGGLPAVDLDDIADATEAAIQADGGAYIDGAGSGAFVVFSGKLGVWTIGRTKEPLDIDHHFLLVPGSFRKGWICWKGGRPVGRHNWPVHREAELALDERELEDHGPYNEKAGEGWRREYTFGMIELEEDRQCLVSFSSKSGFSRAEDLNSLWVKAHRAGTTYAVLKLGVEGPLEGLQGNYAPILDPVAWVSEAAVQKAKGVDDLLGTKPAARGRRKAA